MTRAMVFIIWVAALIAVAYWFFSAKARRAAALLKHKHELDEIETDKKIKEYEKVEQKAKKNG
jgi:beta-lactamase regulating signal transducer with metallopeptidase domain